MLEKWKSYVRANQWWGFKAAPILGFTYFYIYFFNHSYLDTALIVLMSAITVVGIAGFGYIINDYYDIEADKKAGKKNPFDGKSHLFILNVFIVLQIFAWSPWLYLKSYPFIWGILLFQIFLFLIYAHPATRLKEKSIWGPICDSLYGHAVPIIIACLTYQQYLDKIPYSKFFFFATLFAWQFFKGLRNIFLHQLEDYENDILAGIKTLTTTKGKDHIYIRTLRIILPLEILSFVVFLLSISNLFTSMWLFFALFIIIYILGHGLFRDIKWHPKIYSSNTYIYFINNFYEIYLPYFFILWCIIKSPVFIVLFILHVFLFPSTIKSLTIDIKKAAIEIWNQSNTILHKLRISITKSKV
ncbi:MAG: UbiA family prenyltransferase [Chitinophagales bacterium]|nr:UbiA family prenyltransferase [Chitinophagales bacterium]